ncbi:protein BUD31 homolog [Centruroides sculpturatus]|uniref:protein BUD31 homolog n=1 Tax=Centruroides sculpturatus TaxID=218467 RepID=UPI000C6EE958|nr:protein BUD31 homolog [Centruroides sculpturatus]
MPKVRRSRKPPPEGWELIEPTIEELEQKMREAESDPHDGKRKVESLWPIFKIHHQKSRYIFDLYHKRKAINSEQSILLSKVTHCKEGAQDKVLGSAYMKFSNYSSPFFRFKVGVE